MGLLMNSYKLSLIFLSLYFSLFNTRDIKAHTVKYELTVSKENVNLSGNKTVNWALMVNKGIPAPTFEFMSQNEIREIRLLTE